MEQNLSRNALEIKQEVVDIITEPNLENLLPRSFDDIKPELGDNNTQAQINKSSSLKAITQFCNNLQNQIVTTPSKEVSVQKKIKRKVKKPKFQSMKLEGRGVGEVEQLSAPRREIVTVKEEIKVTEMMQEETDSLESLLTEMGRKSNEVLIKNEVNYNKTDNLAPRTCKFKSKRIKSQNDKTENCNKINPNTVQINFSDSNDSDESDLQDFFNNTKPKKRKYRPRRKPNLTQDEKSEKERQKLERRTCQICNAVFALPDGLRNHIRSKHTFEKPYSCKFCSEQFSTRSSHSLHRRRHHGFQPYLCNLCGKTFLQKAHMEIHMRIHIPSKDKIRDVKCNFCSNVYTSKLNLKKHILTKHTDPNEWKHECNICNKKCFSTTDLTHHMRRHNDERKYKCVICGRGFFTKQTMNVHFRTHSASTAFNCEHCSKGYRSNEALQHHMLKVHGIGEEKIISEPKHFCPVCHEGFRQRARLEKHLVIHETGEEEYPFKCEKCNKQYKARNYFTIHMLDKHKEFLDDAYFKTHFTTNNEEIYGNFDDNADIHVENSNSQEFL